MPQLVWVADIQGHIEYFNQRWLNYTGLTLEDVRRQGSKGVVHPEDLDETWERWATAWANRTKSNTACAGNPTGRIAGS